MSAHSIAASRLERVDVISRLTAGLADHRWAFQGSSTAVARWVADRTMGDLDIWVAHESTAAVDEVLGSLGGVLVCSTGDPARLMHRQFWMPTTNHTITDDEADIGAARAVGSLVDVTVGDLKVGPIVLVRERDVAVRLEDLHVEGATTVRAPVLAGAARVADLAVRPLLRGRIIDGARHREATHEYCSLAPVEHALLRTTLRGVVGTGRVVEVEGWLLGIVSPDSMVSVRQAARRRLVRSTLSPRSLRATWRQRSIVLPTRRVGPVGMRSNGVVVALVGTDGSGKSTTAARLADDLRSAGFSVEHQYFGMARGNLPGLGLVRRLAGGGSTAVTASPISPTSPASAPASPTPGLLHRTAAWVYVIDYWWRSIRRVRPAVRRGHVVICDRWVSDLRRHPAPDSPAATVAEWLVGAPDLFVLADAPVDEMVARKPERTLAEASAEQAGLRNVGAELHGRRARGGGRCSFVTIDTSAHGTTPAAERIAPLVAGIVATAHRELPHQRRWVQI